MPLLIAADDSTGKAKTTFLNIMMMTMMTTMIMMRTMIMMTKSLSKITATDTTTMIKISF